MKSRFILLSFLSITISLSAMELSDSESDYSGYSSQESDDDDNFDVLKNKLERQARIYDQIYADMKNQNGGAVDSDDLKLLDAICQQDDNSDHEKTNLIRFGVSWFFPIVGGMSPRENLYADIIDPTGQNPPMESEAKARVYSNLGIRNNDPTLMKGLSHLINKTEQIHSQEPSMLSKVLQTFHLSKKRMSKREDFQAHFSSLEDQVPVTLYCHSDYAFDAVPGETLEQLEQKAPKGLVQLLQNGCNPNPQDHPLVVAMAHNNHGAIALLLHYGSHLKYAGIKSLKKSFQPSPAVGSFHADLKRMRQQLMFQAVKIGSIPLIEQLIELEGEEVLQNNVSHSLFYVFDTFKKSIESANQVLKFLLAQGANPFHKSFPPGNEHSGNLHFRKYISPYEIVQDVVLFDALMHWKGYRFFDGEYIKCQNIMKEGRRAFLWPQVIRYAALIKWIVEIQKKWVSLLPKDVALLIGTYCCDGYPAD